MTKILIYHPFGNENVRNVLLGLKTNNILASYHTTIAIFPKSLIYLLCSHFAKKFLRREYDQQIKKQTICYPFKELIRQSHILSIFGYKNISSGEINIEINKRVAKYASHHKNEFSGVYCYAHGALDIFKICKILKKKCYYDLPIEYYKNILNIINLEKKENPEWSSLIHTYQKQEQLKIIDEEIKLSDEIFVASTYVKNSLLNHGWNNVKIHVIPYGFPPIHNKNYRELSNRKIEILYVGGLHQLKGISYMFEAIDSIKEKVNLTIIGAGNLEIPILKDSLSQYTYLGSLPHNKVLDQMRRCDLLLFPSLSDGFGLVVSEAMSQGTPAIVTRHCGVADLIQDGENGWIIQSRSSKAIKNKIEEIINNPSSIKYCGQNAIETAKKRPWRNYAMEISNILLKK